MASKIAAEQLTIADWVAGLAAIPDRNFTLEKVQDYILRHAVRPETLEEYCFFSKGNYTRNLIFKNDVFECMTICWEIGQASRVHNHRGQNCWMSASTSIPSPSTVVKSISAKRALTATFRSTTPASTASSTLPKSCCSTGFSLGPLDSGSPGPESHAASNVYNSLQESTLARAVVLFSLAPRLCHN